MYFSNSLYSVGAASKARTVGMLEIAASETELPSANFVCITFVRPLTKFPYHFERMVITGTLMKARIESCHDTMNIKIRTPMTCTNDLKKTCKNGGDGLSLKKVGWLAPGTIIMCTYVHV